MAESEQLTGSGEGAGEKGKKSSSKKAGGPGSASKGEQAEEKKSLYDRLGGEAGLSKIVADFTSRVLEDPRVNWERKGVKQGGFLSLHRNRTVTWNPTPENVATLKKHLVQFLALASGGPAQYDGKDMQAAHTNLQISNPEFDAAVGDLKATLDRLQVPNTEQKELLAIVESTRPEIVTVR
jgi:hemoglobin